MQLELLDPRRSECGALAMQHASKAEKFSRAADLFSARGWSALCDEYRRRAREHDEEAQTLADYAFLLDLAKVDA
jgi:hypothetical protein